MKSFDLTLHDQEGALLSSQQGAMIAGNPTGTRCKVGPYQSPWGLEKAEGTHPEIHWKGAKVRGSRWPSSSYHILPGAGQLHWRALRCKEVQVGSVGYSSERILSICKHWHSMSSMWVAQPDCKSTLHGFFSLLLTDGNTITGVNVGSVRFLYTGAILVLCCDDTVLVFWLGSGTKAQLGSVEDYALTDTILMPQTQLESHLQCSVFFDCKFSKIYGFTALHTAGNLLTSSKICPGFALTKCLNTFSNSGLPLVGHLTWLSRHQRPLLPWTWQSAHVHVIWRALCKC